MLAWALLSDAVNSAIAVRDMKNKMRSLKSLSTILLRTLKIKKLCKLLLRINNERLPKTSNKNLFKRNLKEDLGLSNKKAKADGDYAELNQLMGVINSGASSVNQLVNPLKMFKPSKDSAKDFLNPK